MTRLFWAGLIFTWGGAFAFAQDPLDTPPPGDAEVVPADDPAAQPIEEQPQSVDPAAVPPADIAPPPPGAVAPPPGPSDPAYVRPVPEGADAEIPIADLVRNPVRIYEARLLVLMGHAPAATEAIDILGRRFPTDARVPYLRYFLQSRSGQPEAALESLRQAVSLETVYPIGDYNRFMEPIQGPDRFYVERVRRAAAEVAALDRLADPAEAELLPAAGPMTGAPGAGAVPPGTAPLPPGRPGFAPRGVAPAVVPKSSAAPADVAPEPGVQPATEPDGDVAPEAELPAVPEGENDVPEGAPAP